MTDSPEFCMMMTTCNKPEVADRICQALMTERLAAAVHVLPIQAHYIWHDQVVADEESLLMIKTRDDLYSAVAAKILQLHDYDLPQIIKLPITAGSADYLDWMRTVTKRAG
jgi:periplasmic divalent cation tolerance protein